MNDATKKAYDQGQQIRTLRRDAETWTDEAAREVARLVTIIGEQKEALRRGQIGEAEYHRGRIQRCAEEIDAQLHRAQTCIAQANGRDPF